MSDDFQLYAQGYLQENEELCDICRNVRTIDALKEVEVDDKGGTVLVCSKCIEKGWAEE